MARGRYKGRRIGRSQFYRYSIAKIEFYYKDIGSTLYHERLVCEWVSSLSEIRP